MAALAKPKLLLQISSSLYNLPLSSSVDPRFLLIPGLQDRINQQSPLEEQGLHDSLLAGVESSSQPVYICPIVLPYKLEPQIRKDDTCGYLDLEHDTFVDEFIRLEKEQPFSDPENRDALNEWLANITENGKLHLQLTGKHRMAVR